LDEGTAVVIGLPRQFDFSKRLSHSSHIRMATAFAHMSGWNLIGDFITKCKGQVDVVAGLSFFQTEPLLLTRWSKLSHQADNFCCRVVTNDKLGKRTFHPKVLIASGSDGTHFAVVGSGNLSAGGLRHNVECSIFTEDKKLIANLRTWFDDVYKNLAVPVDEAIIRRYKPLYDKYRARSRSWLTKNRSS
jgi:phosphatidylserine/phosphatidylglycerophosphate/cardiolipin synthase-like enzyme